MDFRFYLSLFLRRLHWFIFVALLVSALGIGVARILPTVYLAEATMVVESEQIPDSLAASTVQTQAIEQMQIIQQRILSRDTLVDMANRLKIYAPQPGEQPVQIDADTLVEDLRERIKIVTTGGTAPRGQAQATLVSVSFEAPTATLAAVVVNDVVTQILRTDVEMRTGSARETLDFFEQEVTRLDKELAERGAAILKFKEANKDALPESLEFRRNQQAAAQDRLSQQKSAEAELRDKRDRLVRLHDAAVKASNGSLLVQAPDQALTPEQQKLNGLKEQLSASLLVLSPENPKIKMLQAQIDALQKVVLGQTASGQTNSQGQGLTAYDVQLADMEGQLVFMQSQKTEIEDQIQTLQVSIDATASNAIALETLQRDYDATKAQYDLALANKARAATGDTIETMSKGQRITVIEQAVAPTEPARPNRQAIAAAGVGGGLVLGLAGVALIEFLQGGIRRPAELTSKLGITVFATLPYMKTAREIRRRRMRLAVILLLILGAVAVALWAINTYYMPLDLMLDQAIRRISSLIAAPAAVALA
jgi:uncharacterized protein involved in exopolysaccharide biosynthesis